MTSAPPHTATRRASNVAEMTKDAAIMRQMEDLAVQLRVHVRDRVSGTAIGDFTAAEWVSTFHSRINGVIGSWARTFGGALILGGSTEAGRVTVYETSSYTAPLVDLDWFTWTVEPPEDVPSA